MFVILTGKEHLADPLRIQFARLIQLVVKHRLFEKAHLFRAMAVHIPLIFPIDVSDDFRVVTHDLKQVGGNIAVEVMGEDLLTIAIVNPGAVRGDHVRPDAEIIADLPDVDVVTAGGEDEIDPTGGKQLQRLFGIGGQEMIGGKQRAV